MSHRKQQRISAA